MFELVCYGYWKFGLIAFESDARISVIDTLDLQDQNAPSAKDHKNQNINPSPLDGGIAPHQELSIRHADQDTRAEIMHGPIDETGGYGDGIDMYDEPENSDERRHDLGGASSEDGDLTDGEGDDLLDDDLDKISSSPSIDDGALDRHFCQGFPGPPQIFVSGVLQHLGES